MNFESIGKDLRNLHGQVTQINAQMPWLQQQIDLLQQQVDLLHKKIDILRGDTQESFEDVDARLGDLLREITSKAYVDFA